jgi:arsenite-transporting ATPase
VLLVNTTVGFFQTATRIVFFTGKGGVGKTSLACAMAVALADRGRRVLLVSTDPASNLDEVLGTELAGTPRPIPGAAGLFAVNIDPEAAARAYRERVVGPYRILLPEAAVASIEEQLSGACTTEIAAFDEFSKLLGDPSTTSSFDHVIFDTAPTGHTLRLLKLPAAWTGFIATNTTGTSCLGPLAGLQAQKDLYQSTVRVLSDGSAATVVLVSKPETSALQEAERTRLELAELGLTNQWLALNGIFAAQDSTDEAARALEQRGRKALDQIPAGLAQMPRCEVPLLSFAPMGVELLRQFSAPVRTGTAPRLNHAARALPPSLRPVIDEIERRGRGVVMTMGKGGVGKTTVAAAIAAELAHRGHPVHLSTTDPAAHVAETIENEVSGLSVRRIDPQAEVLRYSAEVLAKCAPQLDAKGRALLEEDLRSPCTEEIAVFRAFAETVAAGEERFVVLDTAPTGHTLLLLDATEAYHRQVSRTMSDMPEAVRSLLPRLRDPNFTSVILVTLPEATPVHEAARLQDDLLRAGIQPFAWVINQSFAGDGFRDPLLVERGMREFAFIDEVVKKHAARVALIPWTTDPPVGRQRLRQLIGGKIE